MTNRELADRLEDLSKLAQIQPWDPSKKPLKGAAEAIIASDSELVEVLRSNLPTIISALRAAA